MNIETVGKLSELRDLTLENCDIADVEFLSNLTELRSINLNRNFIAGMSPLADMTKLERLKAAENEIKDISPLKDLSGLFALVLNGNEISDISALSGLSRLNQVELADNQILDLTPLEGKKELMYLSVSGNPYKDLRPVWHVPVLFYICQKVTDREAEFVKSWMEEQYPTIPEFECIDYMEGDLNKDGRTDIAFVVDGIFEDEDGEEMYDEFESSRRLFVLLNQRDGFWREAAALSLMGKYDGGTRGDPYLGSFMGGGYLITKEGWGSGSGAAITEIYLYQGTKLEQVREIWVEDYNYTDNYNVTVTDVENDARFRYIYIYYYSLCGEDGGFCHEICYVTKDGRSYYTIDDNTGEMRGG